MNSYFTHALTTFKIVNCKICKQNAWFSEAGKQVYTVDYWKYHIAVEISNFQHHIVTL